MWRTDESIDVRSEDPIRVVLAEDHAEFRLGLKEMLATDGGIEVVGEAENGAQAVALAREVRPDVVVLDLMMPVMEGTEALGLILRDVSPPPGIVILTMHNQPHMRRELMRMGASAFLAKSASLGRSHRRGQGIASDADATRGGALARRRRLLSVDREVICRTT